MLSLRGVLIAVAVVLGGCAEVAATRSVNEAAHAGQLTPYLGKAVLLTFGATWCPMCAIELRELEQAQRNLRGAPLHIVAVLVDDDRERIAAFVQQHGLTFPVLSDDGGQLQSQFKVLSLPATIALDSHGHQIPLTDPETGQAVMQIDGPRSWDKPDALELLRRLGK